MECFLTQEGMVNNIWCGGGNVSVQVAGEVIHPEFSYVMDVISHFYDKKAREAMSLRAYDSVRLLTITSFTKYNTPYAYNFLYPEQAVSVLIVLETSSHHIIVCWENGDGENLFFIVLAFIGYESQRPWDLLQIMWKDLWVIYFSPDGYIFILIARSVRTVASFNECDESCTSIQEKRIHSADVDSSKYTVHGRRYGYPPYMG